MEFEWDEAKRASNILKHGLDFRDAVRVFLDRKAKTVRSDRKKETRWQILGEVEQVVLSVAFTKRGKRIRIISFRRATTNEIEYYEDDKA